MICSFIRRSISSLAVDGATPIVKSGQRVEFAGIPDWQGNNIERIQDKPSSRTNVCAETFCLVLTLCTQRRQIHVLCVSEGVSDKDVPNNAARHLLDIDWHADELRI